MNKLNELHNKIKYELDEQNRKEIDVEEKDTKKKKKDPDRLGTRRTTKTLMTGLAHQVFRWKIKYEELKKEINEKVSGVVVTRRQAEEIFKIIKRMIESSENNKKDKNGDK